MSRSRSRRSEPRRSRSSRRHAHCRPDGARRLESLEPRWLLASDTLVELNLASNQPNTALITDPALGFAWGIASSPGANGGFSVSDTTAQRSNSYSGDVAGSPFAKNLDQTVSVPLATGQVYNASTTEFATLWPKIPPGSMLAQQLKPTEFLYASLDGGIYGYSPGIGPQAVQEISVSGASFTGLTLANNGTEDRLYAADFLGGKIDVFGPNFSPVTPSGSFTDPNLPAGYKPFNIVALDNPTLGTELYVSYAPSPSATPGSQLHGPLPPVAAPGGVVDVFDSNGNFVGRVASGTPLDQPWGMALAPASFGQYAGDLLVANHGDGKINVFDPTPGATATPAASLGVLSGADGNAFVIDGLLGLTVGNGDGSNGNNAGDSGSLYFTAGSLPNIVTPLSGTQGTPSLDPSASVFPLAHGLFGSIQVAATSPLVAVGTDTTAVSGKPFTGALAVLGSADAPSSAANPVASYTATIDWGDGSSTSVGTVVPTGNGGYVVEGSHIYSSAGPENYQVTIQDTSGNTATATGTVQVTAATLLAHALSVESHGLVVNDGTDLAAFVDTGGADSLSNYSATINWGDNTSSSGTISAASLVPGSTALGGYFDVSGGHTYTATGAYTFTVAINDTDGSSTTVTGTVNVLQATLEAKALPVESQSMTLTGTPLAAFVDTGGADSTSDYTATINWGDSTTSSGTIEEVVADPGGNFPFVGPVFLVQGDHAYTAGGTYTVTVDITDTKDNIETTVTGTVSISQATLEARALPVESQSLTLTNAAVAGFVDTGGADPTSDYTATINWGDNSSSSGTIHALAAQGDAPIVGLFYDVEGNHSYTAGGTYTVTVDITDTKDNIETTVTGTVSVSQGSSQATLEAKALPVDAQGLTIDNARLAWFTDTGGPDMLTDYSATIDWGDGTPTSPGTIGPSGILVPVSNLGGYLSVEGSHTYSTGGSYTITLTISDTNDSLQTSVTDTVTVAQPTLDAKALPVDSAGLAIDNARLAVFTDTGGPDLLTDYSATINWGDGTPTSSGTFGPSGIDPAVNGAAYVSVEGSHTYAATGTYSVTLTISDTKDNIQTTVTGTVTVAQPTLDARALPVDSPGLTLTGAPMASFVDTGGADPASDYTATINWGDNSSSSGTIHALAAEGDAPIVGLFFTVNGDHTYTAPGAYTFTVAITDTADGLTTTVTGTAHVAQAPLLAAGVPVVVTSGLSVTGAIVAAFADASGGDNASNYAATIDWGDGTSSPADSITGSGNSFIVVGSHTYASPGAYALKISISDQDGSSGDASAHAFIDSPTASYVVNAFQDILHRQADDAGLSYWAQQITAGMSNAQFASDLTHSAEYYDTNVIGPAYQKYLGRAADTAGMSYWTGQLQQGMTDQQMQAEFLASPEFYANAGGTDTSWIDALYQSVLGRAASSSDIGFWQQQLAGGTNRSTVAADFATSQEHAAQAVENDYFSYLGRAATAAEVNYWVAQFENGATNEDVISGFVGSPEFFKVNS